SIDHPVIATYREFAPRRELRKYVRSFFSFVRPEEAPPPDRPAFHQVDFRVPGSFCSPVFADCDASLVIDLGSICRDSTWESSSKDAAASVMGAITRAATNAPG